MYTMSRDEINILLVLIYSAVWETVYTNKMGNVFKTKKITEKENIWTQHNKGNYNDETEYNIELHAHH